MKIPDEMYVIIVEHDGSNNKYSGPIVWETRLDEYCTKEAALRKASTIKACYGETRIARIVFEEDDHLVERLKSHKEYEIFEKVET